MCHLAGEWTRNAHKELHLTRCIMFGIQNGNFFLLTYSNLHWVHPPVFEFKPLWGQCLSYENMFSERIFIIGSSQCIKTKLFAMLFPIYSKIPLVIPFIMALDLTQWGYVWFYRPFSCNWFLCSKSAGLFFRNIGHSPFPARYFSRKKGDIVDMCAKNKKRRIHAPNISINM